MIISPPPIIPPWIPGPYIPPFVPLPGPGDDCYVDPFPPEGELSWPLRPDPTSVDPQLPPDPVPDTEWPPANG